jgi:hypothetical protein
MTPKERTGLVALIKELRLQARINARESDDEPDDMPEITWGELDDLATLMRRAADALATFVTR